MAFVSIWELLLGTKGEGIVNRAMPEWFGVQKLKLDVHYSSGQSESSCSV